MNFWFAELGQLLLVATFAWALFGLLFRSIENWSKVQFLMLSSTLLFLALCFLINDFSVQYVYTNSHTLLPWYYRICAVWGAHEGSWLLWTWLLSLYTWFVINTLQKNCPKPYIKALELNVAAVMTAFTGFMVFTSNPFLRSAPLTLQQGQDLNPLLQDPGMIIHPPLLYLGYVGFVLVFAMALAAIRQEKYNNDWQNAAFIVAKTAWIFLTAGIVLGSWWAYRELGWGGFWGWDPVENASLLPWLTGTALVHLLIHKQHSLLIFIYAATCFFLSILGTFLLRSGLVISVHAFAEDPSRGLVLLLLLTAIITICCYFLYVNRHKIISKTHTNDKIMQAQAYLFGIAAFTVLLGTMYPLISQVLWHENLSVGAPYFNKMLLPSLIMALALMSFVLRRILEKRAKMFLLLGVSLAISYAVFTQFNIESFCFTLVVFVTLITLLSFGSRRIGFVTAHTGFMIMLIGAIITSNFTVSNTSYIKVGDTINLTNDIKIKLINIVKNKVDNYTGYLASFKVNEAEIVSEERLYSARSMVLPKVGIITSLLGSDTYIAFGHSNESWVLRAYYRPLVRWIWYGGILMVFGALISFWERKK